MSCMWPDISMPSASYNSKNVRLHVVALKAFALGAACAGSLVVVALLPLNSLRFRLAAYVLSLSIFHLLEFLSTALFNTSEVDDDSFILNDSDLHMVFAVAVVEAALHKVVLPFSSKWLIPAMLLIGAGQTCRTLAMYTAGVSFNHYIQKEHSQKHVLVTDGIYRYLRHPSYFGYFWWFVGTQVLLQNWLLALAGAYKLFCFFRARIEYEEELLVEFFGDEYRAYRLRTRVGIPLIK